MRATHHIAMLILGIILEMPTLGQSPERNAWLAERREMIARARTISDEQAIIDLSRIVRGIGRDIPNSTEEAKQLHAEALSLLLAIPGHALYFRDRINNTRGELEKALATGEINMIGSVRGKLSNEIMFGLQTLEHLPSPETVGVLGEFLFDERGFVDITGLVRTEENMYLEIRDGPVFANAAKTLDALPIVAKPVQTKIYYVSPSDTEPWRQWYREIKEGKRTFRFEGDPTEYDLNGPAPSQKLERIARDRLRDEERSARRSASNSHADGNATPLNKKPSPVGPAAWIAVGALLVAALAWFFRGRARQPAHDLANE